jgi:hypothetical protein
MITTGEPLPESLSHCTVVLMQVGLLRAGRRTR